MISNKTTIGVVLTSVMRCGCTIGQLASKFAESLKNLVHGFSNVLVLVQTPESRLIVGYNVCCSGKGVSEAMLRIYREVLHRAWGGVEEELRRSRASFWAKFEEVLWRVEEGCAEGYEGGYKEGCEASYEEDCEAMRRICREGLYMVCGGVE
jgi:flagellar biosynthesis/type III secretory pathway protein FliH